MNILISHMGYSVNSNKRAVLQADKNFKSTKFNIRLRETSQIIYTGQIELSGKVDNWKDWFFFTMDFSELKAKGRYFIEIDGINSEAFNIKETIFDKNLHHEIICYFRANRSTGIWDRHDKSASFVGNRSDKVDVSGGWYDASGDYSKYLTHLSYANFMNPQQIPATVWHMLKVIENNTINNHPSSNYNHRVIEEAIYGADFLVKMLDKDGYFYTIVFDKWSKDPKQREICLYETMSGHKNSNYKAGYREGAGIAIAALAKASLLDDKYSEFSSQIYLDFAIKAFSNLEKNNLEYLNDGQENIIDDYCALLAATELYKVTKDDIYLNAANKRAKSLAKRQTSDEKMNNWFRADNDSRPFFHAAEAGFPIIALIEYLKICDDKKYFKLIIKKSLEFELNITNEVNNPFGYGRQYTQDSKGNKKTSFFYPHNNESGYWWQGENARLASLAAAAYMGSEIFNDDKDFSKKLIDYGNNQIYWIVGLNPYDICMLYGRGRNNPDYEEAWPSFPGGICNGITSGFLDESDIDFQPESANTGNNKWRWGEQWIPHASWFLFASSIIE